MLANARRRKPQAASRAQSKEEESMADSPPPWARGLLDISSQLETIRTRIDTWANEAPVQQAALEAHAPPAQDQIAALRQDIQRLQLQANRQKVVASKRDDAIAGRTNSAEYELGQNLALSKEGDTVLSLRKILQQIQQNDITDATVTIQEALTYYQLEREHSWTIAKNTWKTLTEENASPVRHPRPMQC